MVYTVKFYDRSYTLVQDQVDALPTLKNMFSRDTSIELHSGRSPKLFAEVLEYVAGSRPILTPELIDELDFYGINIFDGISVDKLKHILTSRRLNIFNLDNYNTGDTDTYIFARQTKVWI